MILKKHIDKNLCLTLSAYKGVYTVTRGSVTSGHVGVSRMVFDNIYTALHHYNTICKLLVLSDDHRQGKNTFAEVSNAKIF